MIEMITSHSLVFYFHCLWTHSTHKNSKSIRSHSFSRCSLSLSLSLSLLSCRRWCQRQRHYRMTKMTSFIAYIGMVHFNYDNSNEFSNWMSRPTKTMSRKSPKGTTRTSLFWRREIQEVNATKEWKEKKWKWKWK